MEPTTVGTLLLNDSLPPELQIRGKAIDKKELMPILRHIAEKYPDRYKDVIKTMNDVGRDAAFTEGVSVSLSGLRKTDKEKKLIQRARSRVMAIETSDLDPDAKKQAITDVMFPMVEKMQEALKESGESENNPYWFQVKSGARGKMSDYNAIRGASGLVNDHRNEIVPIPILHSLSEGLDPVEYWAGTYGQRRGMIAVKMSTADAGFLCFTADTLVRMADLSVKAIVDIRAGDWVLGADHKGVTFPVQVLEQFHNGKQHVNAYRFRAGRNRQLMTVVATPAHQVLSVIKEGTRRVNGKIVKKRPLSMTRSGFGIIPAKELDADLFGGVNVGWRASLVGILLGNGGITGHDTTLSTDDVDMVSQLNTALATEGFVIRKIKRKELSYEYSIRPIVRGFTPIDVNGSVFFDPFRAFLFELGMLGKYAHEKTIPPAVWGWHQRSVANLLGGLIASDGCITNTNHGTMPILRFGVTSEQLAQGMKDLLEVRFGIYCTPIAKKDIDKEPPKDRLLNGKMRTWRSNHPIYTFTVSGREAVERLADLIPVPGRKGEKLRRLVKLAKPRVRNDSYVFAYVDHVSAGEQDVYDIEVAHPDHLYVLANGMVVSNSKKLANAAHRIVVNKDAPPMTRLPVGLPTKTSDADNIGAVLAKDAGAHKAGERITSDILESLSEDGIEDILVHSPMTEPSEDGGISRAAAGRRDRTELSHVGDSVGIAAAQSIGAPLSQATLNEKHSAVAIGAKKNLRTGFEYLNRVIESPETFPESGPLAEVDGVVKGIRKAPQGGQFVTVGDRDYYLHPGIEPVVKPGDALEAGDDISDGAPHPEQLVRLKGVGEARRRYAEMLQEALTNSGIKTHRRNIETVVAGLINWVKVTNPNGIGDHIVDDIASYNSVAGAYKARPGTKRVSPTSGVGKYLEEPVLHYTPGTRITKKVAGDLQKWGVKDVDAHDDEPDFQPVMQRGVLGVYNDNDWQTRLSGFYTSSGFLDSVHRSRVSDPNSTSYVPALAKATGFGDTLKTTGAYGTPPLPTSPPRSPR